MAKSYNGSEQINTFTGGMNLDLDHSIISKDAYIYGQNVRVILNDASTTGVLQGLEGIEELSPLRDVIPSTERIIGIGIIRDYAAIFTEDLSTGLNTIYRFRMSGSNGYELVKLTTQDFKIGRCSQDFKHMSIATKWEDADNVKVYWVDGCNQLRVINIWEGKDIENENANIDYFGSIPKVLFNQPEFVSFGSGSLKCGVYQYAYQLFAINGGRTTISPLSNLIHLTSSNTHDINYKGNSSSDNSTKSVKMQVQIEDSSFTQIRIYAIYYSSFDSAPTVRIVQESEISTNPFVFVDNGAHLSDVTYDEFVGQSPYSFVPRVIEAKNDRLFAANIVEDTWTIPDFTEAGYYDTRVFSYNRQGNALLYNEADDVSDPNAALKFTIAEMQAMTDDQWKAFLPENHDCINPVNYFLSKPQEEFILDNQDCFYGDASFTFGGVGRNISYRTIHTMLGESAQGIKTTWDERGMGYIENPDSKLLNTWNVLSNYQEYDYLPYWYNLPNNVDSRISDGQVIYKNAPSTDRCINYANEKIDGKLKGYQREGLYRFGVVFYNERGLTTPVNWIADIRMPAMNTFQHRLFDQNKLIPVGNANGSPVFVEFEIATYPMGLEFTFNSLPEGTVALEIVRCERTVSDRNILAQGVLSNTANWQDNYVRPLVMLSLGKNFNMTIGDDNQVQDLAGDSRTAHLGPYVNSQSKITQPFTFASPEISVSRDKFDNGVDIKNIKINPLYGLMSPHKVISYKPQSAGQTVFAVAQPYSNSNYPYPAGIDGTRWYAENDIFIFMKTLPHDEGPQNGSIPTAVVSKYFNPFNEGYTFTSNHRYQVNEFKIAQNIDPYGRTDAELDKYVDTIGSYSYTNWVVGENQLRNVGWDRYTRDLKEGPHGVAAVLTLTSNTMTDGEFWLERVGGTNRTSYFGKQNIYYTMDPDMESRFFALNYTFLTNLIQDVTPYGGLSYLARTTSKYVSTTKYLNKDDSLVKFPCFGGDTYVGIHDYAVTYPFYTESLDKLFLKTSVTAYFPCESSINLSLMHGANFHNYANVGDYPTELHLEPTVVPITGFTQDEAMYGYNNAYSVNSVGRQFLPKNVYSQDDKGYDYRVHYSEAKTNDELYDNWLDFKPANYLDVDTRYGSINNMLLFKNELFFWQDDAFGVLSVMPRSLITDNNMGALLLGTGDVLSRYDYISIHNGSKKNMMNNIVQSPSTLFWYDWDRSEILSFDRSLDTLSKIKGTQSHMNKHKESVDDHMITVYDKKYNDVYFKFKYDDSYKDNNLLYNEQIGGFTSFVTMDSDWFMDFKDKLLSVKDLRFYKHNSGKTNEFYDKRISDSIVKYVINDNYPYTKVYDNVTFDGNVDSQNITNLSFLFDTKTQTSNLVNKTDIDKREDSYRFAIPRENDKNTGRMRGKNLITTTTISPSTDNYKINYIKTIYRFSNI